ncbi:protein ROLLING AND ERECT LEAF 2-like [Arachis stenosperma]|uniref:protein ROLLING AND ERECT LEAF 2-like n=1 Tax=Arachis stenosperma TaxID=217475 RepID=UPI0025AD4D22|nr:protein ROLLING AND ERECT LEAF 2-like [Arachis stenosperma]
MGCGGSKVDHLPLVTLCRERRDFLRAASDHRYALAAAHVAYFHSLRDIGEALRKFADHDLVFATASASVTGSSPSPLSSPVLTLPSDQGKPSKNTKTKTKNKIRASTSSTSISHGGDASGSDEIDGGSHIHLSDSDSELRSSSSGHIHIEDEEHDIEEDDEEASPPYGYGYYHDHEPQDWGHNPQGEGYNSNHTYAFYMKRTAPPGRSMIYEEPQTRVAESGQWPDPQNSYGGYGFGYNGSAGGYFGFPSGSSPPPPGAEYSYYGQQRTASPAAPPPPPAPPSPPRVSAWDFLNVFDSYDNGYSGYLSSQGRYGFGSISSSPDSNEVREREGIPELEDETEQEVLKEVLHNHREKEKKKILNEEKAPPMQNHQQQKQHFRERDFGEGTSNSKAVPVSMPQQRKQQRKNGEGSSNKTVRFHGSSDDSGGGSGSLHEKEIKTSSSPDTIVSRSSPEEEEEDGERLGRKKGVTFEVEATVSAVDGGDSSSKMSSLTTLSPHGTRDLKEVVQEIRDEFETASNVGKEVALLLEACKPPYRSRVAPFKVMFSRIVHSLAPSRLPSHPPSRPPVQLSSRAMKMAKAYCGEPGREFNTNPLNLSSTLEKLYAWEKKLYKEVKDEERLRSIYEKQCKRLKTLDNRGAESTKIDATEASIKKLLTKINISIRTVEAISLRIHKLRDDELQPQLAALITGLTRMWKFMLKCHEKQFQAIMESKTHSLKINTGLQRDESLKAILELEKELLNWCSQFNNWVRMQKSYVENLNEWLRRCLLDEPEETADGVVPFSPSRIGAPPVFVICNDWHQAMSRISERGVADAMHEFAQRLHELWEKQDEAQRQRIKAEYLKKDFEMQLRTLRREMGDTEHVHDKVSQKTALSKGHSESGVSPLDDLKVDLDSMKKRLHEERAKHKEAIKQARDAASNSLQAGLIPIFKTLESFTSEVVKAHEQVRLQNTKAS